MKAKDLLIPFGKLYGAVTDARNALYGRGHFTTHNLGAKTISIGNITTGGTGKTPLTALVAELLADRGENVCILTRGYGRGSKGRVLVSDKTAVLVDAKTGGDEPVELAAKLIGKAVVIADADRVAAAAWAKEKFNVSTFILDDGFQHRRAGRDLDIVCIDATNAWGNGRVLPAGDLRENLAQLSRADAFVITRFDLVSSEQLDEIKTVLRKYNRSAKSFYASTKIRELTPMNGADVTTPPDLKLFAFCGIGNPEAFFTGLRRFAESDGTMSVTSILAFSDHHNYNDSDIQKIQTAARSAEANALVTTAKDAVKLESTSIPLPIYVAKIDTVIDDLEDFRSMVVAA